MKLSDEQFTREMEKIGACEDREAKMCKFLNSRMMEDATQVIRVMGRIGMRPTIVDQGDEKAP